jgi:hypothetical protein
MANRVREELLAIQNELNVATDIQLSMLPQVFPVFPERTEVDVHARMIAAKEVGGDFYDFFPVDEAASRSWWAMCPERASRRASDGDLPHADSRRRARWGHRTSASRRSTTQSRATSCRVCLSPCSTAC